MPENGFDLSRVACIHSLKKTPGLGVGTSVVPLLAAAPSLAFRRSPYVARIALRYSMECVCRVPRSPLSVSFSACQRTAHHRRRPGQLGASCSSAWLWSSLRRAGAAGSGGWASRSGRGGVGVKSQARAPDRRAVAGSGTGELDSDFGPCRDVIIATRPPQRVCCEGRTRP